MDTLRLPEGELSGCWVVDAERVNMRDLANWKPGRIIRVEDMNAVRYIPPSLDTLDRVAGLISDAA